MKYLDFEPKIDTAHFILRLFIGLMFIAHGVGKVFLYGGIPETIENFVQVKQFPAWTAIAAIFLETIAGLMLVLGIQIRLAALVLMPVTIGIIVYHFPFGWVFSSPGGGWEYPQFILISLIVIFLIGEDKFSISKK